MATKFKNPWAKNQWASQEEQEKTLEQEWAEVDKNEKEPVSKAVTDYTGNGIYIEDIKTKVQVENFKEKLAILAPNIMFGFKYNEDSKKYVIYGSSIQRATNPIEEVIDKIIDNKINLKHSEEVRFYDHFIGEEYQLVNINHYNDTTQEEFLAYAVTHLITEYLWAVTLKIKKEKVDKNFDEEYSKAHYRRLVQDLEVWSYLVKRKQKNWNWFEQLKEKGFLKEKTCYDAGGKIYRDKSDWSAEQHLIELKGSTAKGPCEYISITFINVTKWDEYLKDMNNVNNFHEKVTYDKISF